ncbi:MAG: DNA/RNA non-specific endonuclease, partial [Spirochaetia bacterium]|nr:DNA/RNA non-specific endonuclease [Spirochaetia bacterium]
MGRKKKSLLKRIGITLIILLTAYIVLYFITPSVPSYYYEKENDKVLAGLEIPLLEDGETLILHTGYSLVYDEQTEQARWVAYHLTQDELYGLYDRKDNFRSDPLITTGSAQLEDYRKSGYDRGHLIPAADASWSESAMSETFFMSNMSPQEPKFNRGIWADLEAVVRNFAATNQEVYVVTG